MTAYTVSTRFSSPLNLGATDSLVVTREGTVSVAFTGTSAITGAGSKCPDPQRLRGQHEHWRVRRAAERRR